MNRPIKFRVWDKRETKGMSTQNMLYDAQLHHLWQDFVDYPGYELMQYTGLTDINGKEIYEGDIVRTVKDSMAMVFGACQYTRGEVTWLREAFCLSQKHVGGNEISNYVQCDCYPAPLEIIGNRFDNPELLEECSIAKQMREDGTN